MRKKTSKLKNNFTIVLNLCLLKIIVFPGNAIAATWAEVKENLNQNAIKIEKCLSVLSEKESQSAHDETSLFNRFNEEVSALHQCLSPMLTNLLDKAEFKFEFEDFAASNIDLKGSFSFSLADLPENGVLTQDQLVEFNTLDICETKDLVKFQYIIEPVQRKRLEIQYVKAVIDHLSQKNNGNTQLLSIKKQVDNRKELIDFEVKILQNTITQIKSTEMTNIVQQMRLKEIINAKGIKINESSSNQTVLKNKLKSYILEIDPKFSAICASKDGSMKILSNKPVDLIHKIEVSINKAKASQKINIEAPILFFEPRMPSLKSIKPGVVDQDLKPRGTSKELIPF